MAVVFTQRNSDIIEAIVSECRICPIVDFKNGVKIWKE